MITLHQFPASKAFPNLSPFCVKLETYLKLAKIPYQIKYTMDPRSAPKQKMPYITDENGKKIGDSTLIIELLKTKHGDILDAHLSSEQRAISVAFQRLLEDNLVQIMMYFRWTDTVGWDYYSKILFAGLPAFPALFVPKLIRKQVKKGLWIRGVSRHETQEILGIATTDFKSLSDYLGSNEYFFNGKVSSLDIISFSVMGNILSDEGVTEVGKLARKYQNLVAHVERMRKLAWA